MKILSTLNREQHKAVTTTEGPVLVLAGAGTGKTRVITVRIAHLLDQGVSPSSVLAMTFTNKAAREMRQRVAELVGKKRAQNLFVGTFHAFCIDLLRKHGEVVGLGSFTISDGSDQLAILRSSLREITMEGVSMQPGQVLSKISLLKNQMAEPDAALEAAVDEKDELVARVWQRYDAQLARSKALDFDDILLYALRIMRAPDGPGDKIRRKYRYVMVDEYQDTNGPQYEIVRSIAGKHRNLCVVGDDDQSIYGWRGADVAKILGFERDFKGATVVRLETNYRSTEPILQAANRVIRNNPKRHEKTLRAASGPGPPVRRFIAEDEGDEASGVVGQIRGLVDRNEARMGDIAILFRTGPQARAFEMELRAQNVPYVLVGGMSFFDRKEVRDLVAYLKLVVNPEDEIALLRAIGAPPRGIGKASIDKILAYSSSNKIEVSEAFAKADQVPGVPKAAAEASSAFFGTIDAVRRSKGSLVNVVEELIEAVAYRTEVERTYPDPVVCEQRWGAVEEISNFAENHGRRRKEPTLETFLHELALEADDDQTPADDGSRDAVTLMTLHAAKGLEYPRVYMVGLEEGLLPHTRSAAEDTIDEERRLAYVGITRARRHLTLTRARTRARHGKRGQTMPSRFLYELAEQAPPEGWIAVGEDQPATGPKKKKSRARRGVRRR